MKKKTRNILVMLIVLAAVGIAAAILLRQPPETTDEDNNSSSSAAEMIPLIEKKTSDLAKIAVENKEDKYTILASQKTAEESGKDPTTEYTLQEMENIPLKSSALSSAVNTVLPLSAVKEIETPENLADFGLNDKGEATLMLTYQDGSSDTLILGHTSPGTTGRYVMKDGKVYIASSVSSDFFSKALNFVDTNVISIPSLQTEDAEGNTAEAPDELKSLVLSGKNFAVPIEIGINQNNSTGMTPNTLLSPIEADANSTILGEIMTALKTVVASSAAEVNADGTKLAEYGLAEPYARVDYELNGEKHSIKISEVNEDGNHYMVVDDGNIIYEIASSAVSKWAETDLNALRASYIFLANIQDVSKLTFTENGKTTAFETKREKNEEKSTEENVQYDITATLEGKDVDYEKTYQPLYSELLSLPILSSEKVEYDKASVILTAEYAYFEGGKDVITFYPVKGQERYAVELNGKYSGILRKTSLDQLINNLHKAANYEVLKES